MKTPMMSFMTISGLNLRVCTLRSSKGWNCRHMAWFLGSNLAITSFHEQSYLSVLAVKNIIQNERVTLAVILGNMNQFVCA